MMSQHESQLNRPVDEHDHSQGPEDAPVTLVEYGDYECPYCGQAYPIVKEAQRQLGSQLRFAFRNFLISTSHPHAELAAEAAEAAAAQGKFWEMHDMLYEHQETLGRRHLVGFAERLGLDIARFERDLADHTYAPRVRDDFMGGVRSGVNGTPSFFINGARHDAGWDLDTLVKALKTAAQ